MHVVSLTSLGNTGWCHEQNATGLNMTNLINCVTEGSWQAAQIELVQTNSTCLDINLPLSGLFVGLYLLWLNSVYSLLFSSVRNMAVTSYTVHFQNSWPCWLRWACVAAGPISADASLCRFMLQGGWFMRCTMQGLMWLQSIRTGSRAASTHINLRLKIRTGWMEKRLEGEKKKRMW